MVSQNFITYRNSDLIDFSKLRGVSIDLELGHQRGLRRGGARGVRGRFLSVHIQGGAGHVLRPSLLDQLHHLVALLLD